MARQKRERLRETIQKELEDADPRYTTSIGMVEELRDRIDAGMKIEDVLGVTMRAITSLETRLIALEQKTGPDAG